MLAKKVFRFKSVGKKHEDESGFFKFLVRQEFALEGSRVIQWCKFDGLNVIVEALEPEIIEWAETTLGKCIETSTGYKYGLL